MAQKRIADLVQQIADVEMDASDDAVLDTARSLRLAHIREHLTSADALPTSKEDFDIFDRNLRALESTAIASKRIKADEKANENADALTRIAVMQLQKTIGGDLFAAPEDRRHERQVIDERDIEGTAEIIEGELDIGISEQTHESFMRAVGDDLDAKRRSGEFNAQDHM